MSRGVVLYAILFAECAASQAAVLQKLSLEELTVGADLIASGRCERTEWVWIDKKIYTVATIRLHQKVIHNLRLCLSAR